MASRKDQKEAARQRRLAEERARAERARRTRRLRMVLGTVVGAVVVIGVAVGISVGSTDNGSTSAPKVNSPQAKQAQSTVNSLLAGIPQNGNTLGSPRARVTMTEYGDLVCPICKQLTLGALNKVIANDVRTGKVKIVYKPLETASQTANNAMFVPGQAATLAAGQQKKAWNYIELFYHEQGDETQPYVTTNYLQGLASQIPGLNYSTWNSARQSSSLATQVNTEQQSAINQGFSSTPTVIVNGPVSQAKPIVGNYPYSAYAAAIKSVS